MLKSIQDSQIIFINKEIWVSWSEIFDKFYLQIRFSLNFLQWPGSYFANQLLVEFSAVAGCYCVRVWE
jgi:hypothetical protein